MDYMEDSKWEVMNYLRQNSIDMTCIDEEMIDDMAYKYYKNYYSYEMDSESAVADAVNEVLMEG